MPRDGPKKKRKNSGIPYPNNFEKSDLYSEKEYFTPLQTSWSLWYKNVHWEYPRRCSKQYFPKYLTIERFFSDIPINIFCHGVWWTFVKCRSNQNSIFTDEENNGQTSAKGHKATDRWHSLNKKPGSWLPVQCSLKLHCNDTERIFVRCLLVISWSQGKEILTQKFKTFIYNLEVVQNQVRFWL